MAGLEDLLLFEPRVYWRLFALENEAIWPAQPVLLAACAVLVLCPAARLAAVLALARPRSRRRVALGPDGSSSHCAMARSIGPRQPSPGASTPRPGCWPRSASRAGCHLPQAECARRPPSRSRRWRFLGWPLLAPLDGRSWHEAEVFRDRAPIPPPRPPSPCLRWRNAAGGRRSSASRPALWLAVSVLTLVTMGVWQAWVVLAFLLAGLAVCAAPESRRKDRP